MASHSRRRDCVRNRPHKGGAVRLAQDKPAHQGQEGIRGAVLAKLRVADGRTLGRRVSGILARARRRGRQRSRRGGSWGRSWRSSGSWAPWRALVIRWTRRRGLTRVPSVTTAATSARTRRRRRWRNPRHRSAIDRSASVLMAARAQWIDRTSRGRAHTRPSLATGRQKRGFPCVFVLFPQRPGTVGEMTGWASHYSGNDVMGSSLTVRCCRENGLASSKRERTTAYTIAPMHLGTLC